MVEERQQNSGKKNWNKQIKMAANYLKAM